MQCKNSNSGSSSFNEITGTLALKSLDSDKKASSPHCPLKGCGGVTHNQESQFNT